MVAKSDVVKGQFRMPNVYTSNSVLFSHRVLVQDNWRGNMDAVQTGVETTIPSTNTETVPETSKKSVLGSLVRISLGRSRMHQKSSVDFCTDA